jgi:hypothetical protein
VEMPPATLFRECKKQEIGEYRSRNIGLIAGGSVAALKKRIRRCLSAGEASASQPSPLAVAGTRFFSITVDALSNARNDTCPR